MSGTPQLILFLDPTGTLRAEVAGRSGTRRKIDLPAGAANRRQQMETLLAELQVQQAQIEIEDARLISAKRTLRIEQDIIKRNLTAEALRDHIQRWEYYLASLSSADREIALDKQQQQRQRQQEHQQAQGPAPILQEHLVGDGSVTVRRLPAYKHGDGLKSKASASSLGL